jgi:short-subunit dehydrogenase
MHLELRHDNIQVSVACPSFFATNLDKSLRTKQEGADKLVTKMLNRSDISADQVADIIVSETDAGKFMILTHKAGRTAYRLKRYLPTMRYLNMIAKKTKNFGR